MPRDLDLIRSLLLEVEGEQTPDLSAYPPEAILYHKRILIDEHLAEGPPVHYSSRTSSNIPDMVIIRQLTPDGHKLLEIAKSGTKWAKLKRFISRKGIDVSTGGLKVVLAEYIKSLT